MDPFHIAASAPKAVSAVEPHDDLGIILPRRVAEDSRPIALTWHDTTVPIDWGYPLAEILPSLIDVLQFVHEGRPVSTPFRVHRFAVRIRIALPTSDEVELSMDWLYRRDGPLPSGPPVRMRRDTFLSAWQPIIRTVTEILDGYTSDPLLDRAREALRWLPQPDISD